jgi:membrane protease YdiL (CAAX protease family)
MVTVRRILSIGLVQLAVELALVAVVSPLAGPVLLALQPPIAPFWAPFAISEAIGATIVVLVIILGSVLVERRPLSDTGLVGHHAWTGLAFGFLGGVAYQSAAVGIMALAGWYRVVGMAPVVDWPGRAGPWLIVFFWGALYEEGLFRAIIFRLTERSLGTWISLALSAVLFGAAHLQNPNATLIGAVAIAVEAGVLLAALYQLTGSLWAAVGLHWAWNVFEGAVYGVPVSGIPIPRGILTARLAGPTLWTGGAFGPEAGVIAMAIGVAAGLGLLLQVARRGRIVPGPWARRPTPTGGPAPRA